MPILTGAVCIFLYFMQRRPYRASLVDVISVSDTLVVVSFCSLWDELLRIHANYDWCGPYFPVFYAETTIPCIVDVISVSDLLAVLLSLG